MKSYPVQWIKVVEKVDENAFHRKHMFQIVVVPSGPVYSPDNQVTLYLQAAVSGRGITAKSSTYSGYFLFDV